MNFGERLKHVRLLMDYTQDNVATHFGLTTNSYRHYESGYRGPKRQFVTDLAVFFEIPSFLLEPNNWSYVPLNTNGDLIALLIELLKKGILTIDGKRVLWLGNDDSVVYGGADMVLLNEWYELWSAGKTDEADRLQIQIAVKEGAQHIEEQEAIVITYGEALKKMRKESGLTQIELAEKAGVSVVTIRRLETNQNWPTASTSDKIMQALSTDTDSFLKKYHIRIVTSMSTGVEADDVDELLLYYNGLDDANRKQVRDYARFLGQKE